MMDVLTDPKVQQWYGILELSENTQSLYSYFMKQFCECVDKKPFELIKEAENEIKSGLLPSERKIIEHITLYKKCLKNNNASPKTLITALASIKSFYKAFDIQIPAAVGRVKRAMPLEENMNFLLKEDINNLIVNAANLRDKTIILLMATSGMARNEVINLRMKNITFDDSGIGVIKIRRQKTNINYVTFCSPETVIALKTYFEERNRIAQNVSPHHPMPLDKLKVKGNDDYVFVDYKYGSKITPSAFNSVFRRQADKVGYYNGKGNFRKSRSHSLRKFFASTLENNGIPKNKVDFMLGHMPSGNDLAYFETDIEKLKGLYIEHLPYITFEKTIEVRSLDTKDAERLEELSNENGLLKSKVGELDSKLKFMESFKSEYDGKQFVELVREKEQLKSQFADATAFIGKLEKTLSENVSMFQEATKIVKEKALQKQKAK